MKPGVMDGDQIPSLAFAARSWKVEGKLIEHQRLESGPSLISRVIGGNGKAAREMKIHSRFPDRGGYRVERHRPCLNIFRTMAGAVRRESHQTVPQNRRSPKAIIRRQDQPGGNMGFRLPSCIDTGPLRFTTKWDAMPTARR